MCIRDRPGFCVLVTPFGALKLTPHVARPGSVVTARIVNLSCQNVAPVPGQCAVSWPATGTGQCTTSFSGLPCAVETWMKRTSRCGPQDHTCSWRISRRAPSTRYGLVGISITRGGSLTEDVGETTDYLGILGPKPPPPAPKPAGPPRIEPPVVLLPHH